MNVLLLAGDGARALDELERGLRDRGHMVERRLEAARPGGFEVAIVVDGEGADAALLCGRLRALPEGGELAVLALFADSRAGRAGELLASGADDVLPWPATDGALAARLAVAQRRAGRADGRVTLRALIEQTSDAIYIKDAAGRYVFINAVGARYFDRAIDGVIGKDDSELFGDEDGGAIAAIDRQIMEARAPLTYEGRRFVAGRERVWTTSKVPWLSASGELLGIMGISHDITERKRAEEALLQSERQFRAVFAASLDGMLLLDEDGRCIGANPAAHEIFGLPRGELLDRTLPALLGREVPLGAPVDTDRTRGEEARIARSDGTSRDVEYSPPRLIMPHRYLFVLRDVTERKRLEGRLRLVNKMVSVGTLAAGVAHEINNPLAYVLSNLGFLAESLAGLRGQLPVNEIDASLSAALDGAQRVRDIVSDLKTFSRADEERRGPVDLKRVLDVSVRMVGNEIRHRARLLRDLPELPPVDANESRLGQVLINLLQNAAQAMPERPVEQNQIRVSARALGERVVVEVEDNGSGIPRDVLPRIFDPFFTTKPVGVGTGLGLSICHAIVTAMGGEISVDSELGRGTVFRLALPIARVVSPGPALAQAHAVQRARVLVVDDEPNIVAGVARMLRNQHDVVTETDPREALAQVRKGERFDVVLCDLMMPNMTGMDLYAELVRIAPELGRRTGFLTGGAFTPNARAFVDQMAGRYLEKPFDGETLRSFVRGLLE